MAVCYPEIESDKERIMLLAPALFDPARSKETKKGNDNVVYLRHVWLDFEDGDLKPEEFPSLFPEWRMVVVNSFNHTAEKPRFRVIIPTTEPMTPAIFTSIQDYIRLRLEDAGYSVGQKSESSKAALRSGLDTSKQAVCSQFRLPVQARDRSASFFRYYDEDNRQFLNAIEWIVDERIPIAPEMEFEPEGAVCDRAFPLNKARVDAAISEWRSTDGHNAFFQLAVDLRGAGMGRAEIVSTLSIEAQHSRSPATRRAEIPHIMMKSLEKSRIKLTA